MNSHEENPVQDDVEIRIRRSAMRKSALAAREATPAERRAGWEVTIMEHLDTLMAQLSPRVLAFYWPYYAEADGREWVKRWLAGDTNRIAALPVAREKGTSLTFLRWEPGMEMAPDRHGIPCPASGEEVLPDVALIPLNAFDAHGYRLGYGGGYFDRTLDAMPQMVAVGVGFELGREESVLPQPHDRAMHWLVTEVGVFRAAPD
jgi:5,10-methenyltetrahydrofolate synthetase